MKHLLLIDDSEETHLLVRAALGSQYHLTWVASALDARLKMRQQSFDLILLDVMLPDGDGFSLCAEFQQEDRTRQVPIIFVTGKTGVSNLVTGLSLGADDYIEKPFHAMELLARVNAKIKNLKTQKTKNSEIRTGALYINLESQSVALESANGPISLILTPIEFKILYFLARHEQNVFSRDQIITAVWGENFAITDRTVDKHISTLRHKLGYCSSYIETVSGFGYRFLGATPESKAA
ncbi:MAG: response regulator transcription factor [Bdellovibrionales bacterium]